MNNDTINKVNREQVCATCYGDESFASLLSPFTSYTYLLSLHLHLLMVSFVHFCRIYKVCMLVSETKTSEFSPEKHIKADPRAGSF